MGYYANITECSKKLIRRFDTTDPFRIAEGLGIHVIFCDELALVLVCSMKAWLSSWSYDASLQAVRADTAKSMLAKIYFDDFFIAFEK